jgi:hypothetical protein
MIAPSFGGATMFLTYGFLTSATLGGALDRASPGRHKIHGTEGARTPNLAEVFRPADNNHDGVWLALFDALHQPESIMNGHDQIAKHDGGGRRFHQHQRLFSRDDIVSAGDLRESSPRTASTQG